LCNWTRTRIKEDLSKYYASILNSDDFLTDNPSSTIIDNIKGETMTDTVVSTSTESVKNIPTDTVKSTPTESVDFGEDNCFEGRGNC